MPNVDDIADWLEPRSPKTTFDFGDEYRTRRPRIQRQNLHPRRERFRGQVSTALPRARPRGGPHPRRRPSTGVGGLAPGHRQSGREGPRRTRLQGRADGCTRRLRFPHRNPGPRKSDFAKLGARRRGLPPRGSLEVRQGPRRAVVPRGQDSTPLFDLDARVGREPPRAVRRDPRYEVPRPAGGRSRHESARRAPDARARGPTGLRRRGLRLRGL